jgi:hypothetical protein
MHTFTVTKRIQVFTDRNLTAEDLENIGKQLREGADARCIYADTAINSDATIALTESTAQVSLEL